jgi:hypothetical protein
MRPWIHVLAALGSAVACTTYGSASDGGAGDGGAGAIHCPGVPCSPPSLCCATNPDPSNAYAHAYACVDPPACSGVILRCSTSAACPSGEVCCALLTASLEIETALCLPPGQCRGEVLCEPAVPDCPDAAAPVCLKEGRFYPQLNACKAP